MAQQIKPVILDQTGQDIKVELQNIKSSTDVVSSKVGEVKTSVDTVANNIGGLSTGINEISAANRTIKSTLETSFNNNSPIVEAIKDISRLEDQVIKDVRQNGTSVVYEDVPGFRYANVKAPTLDEYEPFRDETRNTLVAHTTKLTDHDDRITYNRNHIDILEEHVNGNIDYNDDLLEDKLPRFISGSSDPVIVKGDIDIPNYLKTKVNFGPILADTDLTSNVSFINLRALVDSQGNNINLLNGQVTGLITTVEDHESAIVTQGASISVLTGVVTAISERVDQAIAAVANKADKFQIDSTLYIDNNTTPRTMGVRCAANSGLELKTGGGTAGGLSVNGFTVLRSEPTEPNLTGAIKVVILPKSLDTETTQRQYGYLYIYMEE